jgi:glutamyl-tRNA synthetase
MTVRTRFAPSPTGYLHIGGVRTALFNWLLARHFGGQFILRIDDTDQQRHVEPAVKMILEGFRWMNMDWDEGPEVGGPCGPYYQSQRGHIYTAAAEKLLASGHAYRDFSTEEQRSADKAAAEAAKRAYRFRKIVLDPETEAKYIAEGRPFALRFAVPLGQLIVVDDQIKGRVEAKTEEVGDFVIVRPDGTPLYNFATVVDDAQMGITHVVRAEEHLTNTFSQILVFQALGYPLPAFAHVPYVAAPGSKKKLSKRDGAVGLDEYIKQGYLPEAMMNYLSRLGWSYDAETEFFTPEQLREYFTLDRVNGSPASHDPDKLFWLQGEWMKQLPDEQKVDSCIPFLQQAGLIDDLVVSPELRARIKAVVIALGDRLKTFSDIVKLGKFFFQEQIDYDPDAFKKRLGKAEVPKILTEVSLILEKIEPFDTPTLDKSVHEYVAASGLGMGLVVNALRVSTTGQGIGPGVYEALEILGRDECLKRIALTLAILQKN